MDANRSSNVVAETHEVLYRQAFERLEVAYLKSREQGAEDPVFTLIDFSDPLGERIAIDLGLLGKAQDQIREAIRRGGISLGTSWDSRNNIQDLFSEFPAIVQLLDKQPFDGTFHTLIVAEGAVSLRETLIPE